MGNEGIVKKKELKKHVAAVHCSNGLSLLQRKISNALLYHAFPSLKTVENHKISISELCELINYKGNNHEKIKDAFRHLIDTRIEWDVFDEVGKEEGWAASSMLASVIMKKGQCIYAYSPAIREFLHSPTMYAKINLIIQSKFSSGYGLALYENCVRYQDLPNTKWFEMEIFRKIMGVQEELYPIFRDFKRRVLDKAIDEVNSLSELFIEPEFKKHGRMVVAIRFKITQREKKKWLAANMSTKKSEGEGGREEKENILQKMVADFDFEKQKAENYLNDYGIEHIRKSIEYVINTKAYKQGKVKGAATGYLIEAIRSNYQQQKNVHDVIQEKNKRTEEVRSKEKEKEIILEKIKPKYIRYLQETLKKTFLSIDAEEQEKLKNEFKKFLKNSSLPLTIEHHLSSHGIFDSYVVEFFVPFLSKKKEFFGIFITIQQYLEVVGEIELVH